MNAKVFVDTNILVYARDASEGDKRRRAADWLELLWRERCGRLSWQVLREYYVTVTAKLTPGLPKETAREDVRSLAAWNPRQMDQGVVESAWELQDAHLLPWWDSLIVAAALGIGCGFLLSEDFQAGKDFHGVRIVNPFETEPGKL